MLIILIFFILFHFSNAALPQRLSSNTLVLSDQFDNETNAEPFGRILYAVNAGFGPSVWDDGSLDFLTVVSVDDCCSLDTLPKQEDLPLVNNSQLQFQTRQERFVVVTKRSGCSYLRKARNVEKINATALILINREVNHFPREFFTLFSVRRRSLVRSSSRTLLLYIV